MARNEKRLPEGDDGHVIANMNVEGMPWYRPEKSAEAAKSDAGNELSRAEKRQFTRSAVAAALCVTGVMALFIVLFVLFCQFVWFR